MLVDMIGSRLKELRLSAGMNQPEFAAIVGTTKQYVSQLESGKNQTPNGELIEGWARHFGVSMRWLVSGVGGKLTKEQIEQQSHPLKLDPEIVASAHEALRDMYKATGSVYHEADAARFVQVYEKYASRKRGMTEAELIQFGAQLALETTPQGVVEHERSDGVPDEGTDKGNVARRVRRKT